MRQLDAVAGSRARRGAVSRWLLIALSVAAVAFIGSYAAYRSDTGGGTPTVTNVAGSASTVGTLVPTAVAINPGPGGLQLPSDFPPQLTTGVCQHIDATAGGKAMADMMDSISWLAGCIPLFTDDQRFHDGAGAYGPLAHITPAPGDSFSTTEKFDVPIDKSILVGLILVDADASAGPLPATYQALNLSPGFSCVFFRHEGPDPAAGWHAYVLPLTAVRSTDFCPAPSVEQNLRVIATQDKAFSGPGDYPMVGRFREATYAERNHWPLFGLKCGAGFCLVSGDLAKADPAQSEHIGVKPLKTWQVVGWNDEQHVALGDGTTDAQPQWTFNASIIAVPDLAAMTIATFNAATVHVATVYLTQPPPRGSKYEKDWHYEKGENFIFLHHTGAVRDDGWSGLLRHHPTPTFFDWLRKKTLGVPYEWPLKVRRTDHTGVKVVGTARFKWSPLDENDWARCDEGCCEIFTR
jgi:hypothetical protein